MAGIQIIAIWIPFSPIFRVFDTLSAFRAHAPLIWIPLLRFFFSRASGTASNNNNNNIDLYSA